MTEGELKKRIREERLKALHKGMTMICTHDTIEECIENDCGTEYVYKVLEEMKTDIFEAMDKCPVLYAILSDVIEKWLGEKK